MSHTEPSTNLHIKEHLYQQSVQWRWTFLQLSSVCTANGSSPHNKAWIPTWKTKPVHRRIMQEVSRRFLGRKSLAKHTLWTVRAGSEHLPWYWALNPFCLWLPSDVKWSRSQFLLLITGGGKFIPVNLQESTNRQTLWLRITPQIPLIPGNLLLMNAGNAEWEPCAQRTHPIHPTAVSFPFLCLFSHLPVTHL